MTAGGSVTRSFVAADYDLASTLNSGQAFRWLEENGSWTGIIGQHWVRLTPGVESIVAQTAIPVTDWTWLTNYLQLDVDIRAVMLTFPDDEPMRLATSACRGLRLLRQEPWECLASFILSSTKQIVQIRQIIGLLCGRFGEPLGAGAGSLPVQAFPTASRLARATEAELRDCKMGFRAPYLLATARAVADGELDLGRLAALPVEDARAQLMRLAGVGRKIADCVLLFAYGFQAAFPVDVWVLKAMQQLYFPRRPLKLPQIQNFISDHFGGHAGYAQQYLFHYMRTKQRGTSKTSSTRRIA